MRLLYPILLPCSKDTFIGCVKVSVIYTLYFKVTFYSISSFVINYLQLIFLAFNIIFSPFLINFAITVRSKLFDDKVETVKTNSGRWLRVIPDGYNNYLIYDILNETESGRILFDTKDNWIYDGRVLDVYEQEEVAGALTGNKHEMDNLLKNLNL
ncbi:hypothetical protein HYN43_015485 [Mucilaginibacter celer]|uniref:Uncharacterized protein n=1 Tax=Mucilaginibacter celer TaxID=2305508 RepID=A0A494VPE8_9SPHI|nr:hypothetical protein HYN43_015485 [Mucilaginibacter celer]